jgi:superfamily II DNA or RNA helicase
MLIFQKSSVPSPYVYQGKKFISDEKPIRTGAMSIYPYDESLVHLLSFISPFGESVCGAVKSVHHQTLMVPREAFPYADPPNDFRVSFPRNAINCSFQERPNSSQAALCGKSLGLLLQGRNHIFESPTGSGKTVMGGKIACDLGQPTLIVVTKEDLLDQWRDTFLNVLKVNPALIGHVQQDTCDWQGKMFVTTMVQSLIIPDRYPQEMYRHFGLLMLDEVHQMAADCFIRACQMVPARYRLGLSATPDRKDGKTKLLHWHIGPTLVKGSVMAMKPKVLVVRTGWKIPCHRKRVQNAWTYQPIPHGPGRMMLVYKAMAHDQVRNMEIINFARQAYSSDRRCLILCDMREHLDILFQGLTSYGIPGNDIGYYVGGMSKMELSMSKVRKVILGTFKMCSTGTDCPIWDSLVMGTPHADVKQSVGRVLRSMEGKKQPLVLDLVDDDRLLQNFHRTRTKQYWSIGATVVTMK